jgi:hypothetical protein
MQKEMKDKSFDINESNNSLTKSLNRSISRSPNKIGLISQTHIFEEKCNFKKKLYLIYFFLEI